jgi:hypothetical protein
MAYSGAKRTLMQQIAEFIIVKIDSHWLVARAAFKYKVAP